MRTDRCSGRWSHVPFRGGEGVSIQKGGSGSASRQEVTSYPTCEQNGRRFWKHYLPVRSVIILYSDRFIAKATVIDFVKHTCNTPMQLRTTDPGEQQLNPNATL